MRVTAILGSARADGSSALLLEAAVEAAREGGHEATRYHPAAMRIAPCRSCGGCRADGRCVVDDDMTAVGASLSRCDRIVVATPVYFSGMPSQLKALVDRCQPFWSEKYLHGRPVPAGPHGRKGLLVVVGGMRLAEGFGCVGATATAWLRSISVDRHEMLRYEKVNEPEDLRARHPKALDEVRAATLRLLAD